MVDPSAETTSIVYQMERKLNPVNFYRRLSKNSQFCRISTSYYWDWLTYIDDDYLTEWEVLRMKELYHQQLQDLTAQTVICFGGGWLLTFPLMGPVVRSAIHGFALRLPWTMAFGTFFAL